MTGDLVKRLRSGLSDFDDWGAAADRIEELEAKLAKAVGLAEKTIDWLDRYGADACKEEAILAELSKERSDKKGQDDG